MEEVAFLIIQVAVEIFAGLAQPHVERPGTKVRSHPPVAEDNWKCPDSSEFAKVFGNASASANDRRVVPDLGVTFRTEESRPDRLSRWQSASQDPLWDRELDG